MDSDDYDYEDDSNYSEQDYDEEMASASEQGEEDFGLEHADASSRKAPYRVLNKQDLIERRNAAVAEVTSVLGISDEDAVRVLRLYKWDVSRVHEEWFTRMDQVKAAVGLRDGTGGPGPANSKEEVQCLVCFDTFPVKDMFSAACHHYYCRDCWRGYVSTAIASGPASLDLRCPTPKCGACVPASVVKAVVSKEDAGKWDTYALRSFVEDNKKMSWCVGQGCDAAVESTTDRGAKDPLDVKCTNCGTAFCFSCKEEAHRPVACEVVRQWLVKNSAESENVTWIMANTKQCPRCHRPIEKNQGCMHMTCSQCKFEFCWLCNGDWKEHGERTGGYYNCNRFEAAKRKGDYDEETRRRETAKQSLERYMHYFERWDAHQKARNKARQDAAIVSKQWLEKLSEHTKTPTSQLKFIMDAWAQIIDCRRVLSWTYTYGYYSFDPTAPNAEQQENNKLFFEFLQGDAEKSLERLHEAAEKQLKHVMEGHQKHQQQQHQQQQAAAAAAAAGGGGGGGSSGSPSGAPAAAAAAAAEDPATNFLNFRKNLIGLTDVTRGYFDKLVKQLEKGFDELEKDFAGRVDEPPQEAVVETAPAGPSSSSRDLDVEGSAAGGSSSAAAAAAAAAATAGVTTRAGARRSRGGQ